MPIYLGKSLAEIIGQSDLGLFGAELAQRQASSDARTLSTLAAVCCQESFVAGSDGVSRVFEITKTPLTGADGQALGLHALAREITAEKQLQAALKESHARTALLEKCIAHLNDVVLITEAEPYDPPGPRILYVNDAFERTTGYTREEAIGQTPRILQGPKSARPELDRVRKALESWNSVRFEVINYTKAQKEYWVEIEVVPIADESGWYTHWISVQRDITERKATEASLAQTNAHLHKAMQEAAELVRTAEAATLAKSQFLANMSHEIRTPMNGVLGMLELLKGEALNPRQMDYARKTESAARSLLGILNDILDFSKVEAGKMELDPEPFALDSLVSDLNTILSGNLAGKPVKLRFDLDPALPQAIVGDAGRLKQVLINLGGNAIKFTAQGEVCLRFRARRLEQQQVLMAFEVIDSGIGITAEQQAHIFEGFAQAETSISRRFGGTGLGLGISRRLVGLMGGDLKVSSTLGVGSVFSFALRFPVAEVPAPPPDNDGKDTAAAKPSGSGRRLEGLRVLLVEDNLINQMVAQELLQREGAQVSLAENGQLAVDRLLATPKAFDAVLMDLQMPVMDGLQATRHIRQQLRLTRLPIIAMTANVMDTDRDLALQAGMNDHIGKPFSIDNLVARLRKLTRPDDL